MSHNTWGGNKQLKSNLNAEHQWILDTDEDKPLLLTCSTRALGAQVSAPAGAAGSLGELIGRHAVQHTADAAVAFAPPSLLHVLGLASMG